MNSNFSRHTDRRFSACCASSPACCCFSTALLRCFKFPVLPYFANIPPLIVAAGTLELVLGALLMLGLFTRLLRFHPLR